LVSEELLLKEHVVNTVPQQTVYTLTKKGEALLDILSQLHIWGQQKW